jgi:hypothetical protein
MQWGNVGGPIAGIYKDYDLIGRSLHDESWSRENAQRHRQLSWSR